MVPTLSFFSKKETRTPASCPGPSEADPATPVRNVVIGVVFGAVIVLVGAVKSAVNVTVE